ncbi:hypothetical protein B296_00055233, partial [Ensete ventricosum]
EEEEEEEENRIKRRERGGKEERGVIVARVGHRKTAKTGVIEVTESMSGNLRHQLLHHRPPGLPLRHGSLLIPHRRAPVAAEGIAIPTTATAGAAADASATATPLPPGPPEDPSVGRSSDPKGADAAQGGGSGGDQQGPGSEGVGLVHPKHIKGEGGIKP